MTDAVAGYWLGVIVGAFVGIGLSVVGLLVLALMVG